MRKWIGFAALLAGLAVLTAPALPLADAQDKKDVKKDAKKDVKKDTKKGDTKDAGPGSIEIYKAKDGYRFRIKDSDGKTIAMPPKGYEDKADVIKLLDQIKATLDKEKPVEVKD